MSELCISHYALGIVFPYALCIIGGMDTTAATPKPADFRQLIVALGDIGKLADQVNEGYPKVAAWKNRNSIPPKYWPRVLQIARSKRVRINERDLIGMIPDTDGEAA